MNRITIYENRPGGIRIDGFVTNDELTKLEELSTAGGFLRFSIDVWETCAKKSNYTALVKTIKRDIFNGSLSQV